ncbi:MAG: single-stranded DNA-binding protein [Planctomycetota bacterium]|jgi:single-strand DNA-binding protein
MANYNKVILIGNLTRDPQLSYLPSQTAVVEIGLAVNRRWRSQDGEQREETCFVDCKAFGKQAETLNQYMRKGRPIMVEGRLQLSQWEDKDGARRSKLRVVIENFQFLGGGQGGGQGGDQGGGQARAPAGESYGGDQSPPAPPSDDFAPPGGDDIPF